MKVRVKTHNELDKALETIVDYCKKHKVCESCRFQTDSGCVLKTNVLPCDWELKKE